MKSFTRKLLGVALLLGTGFLVTASNPSVSFSGVHGVNRKDQSADAATRISVSEAYGKLPMSFEANQGQTDSMAKFLSRGSGYSLFLTPTEAVLSLTKSHGQDTSVDKMGAQDERNRMAAKEGAADTKRNVVRIQMLGANTKPKIAGVDELPGKSNYFTGNDPKKWVTNVPQYARVKYEAVYPGIDLVFYGNQRLLEYDWVVAPGADPKAIRLRFDGAKKPELDAEGNLVLNLGSGDEKILMRKPSVYQTDEGNRQEIQAGYVLQENRVGIQVAAYNVREPLIIDPVLVYSTYLGGSNEDYGFGIAVDGSGNAFVAGYTQSTDFPTASPLQAVNAGTPDVFVAKINATGSALLYATYIGGSGYDASYSIAVDSSGNAYVTGNTSSTDFPTVGPLQPVNGGGLGDAIVAKLNSTGSALIYSTYLGGIGWEFGFGIAVDGSNNAYVTGRTTSTNFPTVNPLQASWHGNYDAFVAKLNAAGSALVYSTYLGGGSNEQGQGIAVDTSGNAYVTGYTQSTNFPTADPLQGTYGGNQADAFVSKLNAAGSALVYSTFLGGNSNDNGFAIAVDGTGNAYVTGVTQSTNFPTLNSLQTSNAGGFFDVFVSKFNSAGSALMYSTYLGGSGTDQGRGIAVDTSGNAYVTGTSSSTDFPTANPIESANGTGGFVSKFNPSGSALVYSTYLGGYAIAVDGAGNAYVTGYTSSTSFPTVGPLQASKGGGTYDAFVAKIGTAAILTSITLTPADSIIDVGQTQQFIATGTFSDGSTRVLTSGGDSWTNRAPMPTARGQLAAGVINDIVYAIGGFFSDPSYITHATLEAYDPLTDTWSSKAPMPTPRSSLGAGVVNGILYAVGGANTYNLGTVEAYDPATDSWTTKASMFTSRSEVGIGVVGGILYAVGGSGGAGFLATVEAYDPITDTWTTKTPMPTARSGPAVAVVNGILYAIGGNVGQTSLTVVEAYNPTTDTWTSKAPMPSARCCMGSGVIDGIIYVAGGFNSLAAPSYVPVFEAYDPVSDTWTTKDPVPTNVFGNTVGVVNSVLYSIGGFSPGVPPTYDVITLDAVYAYAPPGEVTWSSFDMGVATIDPIGLASGFGPGTTTITATSTSDPGISGNTTLTVISPTHMLTLGTAGSGSGTVGGAGTYNNGDTAAVTATPDAGSLFVGWTGPDAVECATGFVLMDADKSCTANFNLDLPDLILTAVTPNASTANQGGTLSANDTVMNQGTMAAGTFRIAYHLSTDNIYGNGDDVAISTIRTVTSLAVGASDSATTGLSIPSNAPGGDYHLCAMADSIAQVAESDETNNTLCSTATVTLPSIDLVMTAVSTATTVVAPGKTLSVSNTVKNQGGFGAGSFRIGFYLSVNSDGSTPDVAISATRTLSSLAAGASSTGTKTLTIPSTTPPDNYYVCAMADSLNQVTEADEMNNVLCTGGTIQVSLPDLSMTDVTPNAATANPGGTLSVTTTVSNGGSASGAFRIAFRLSPNTVYGDSDDVVITVTRSVTSLAGGASNTGTTNLTVPGATPSGDYHVCTLADSLHQVAESDEGNNTLCSGSQVNVP